MTDRVAFNPLQNIEQIPASDLNRLGWRGVMKRVAHVGRVVVTNRGEPEAVILSIREYTALVSTPAGADHDQTSPLEALRRSFDERLAVLREPDAGDRLRALIDEPTRTGGMVKAGASH